MFVGVFPAFAARCRLTTLCVHQCARTYMFTLMSIVVYSVYRAFSLSAFLRPVSLSEVDDALRQFCKTATLGHFPFEAILQKVVVSRNAFQVKASAKKLASAIPSR